MDKRSQLAKIFKQNASHSEPSIADVSPVITRLTGVKAIVFDVYGTLFQSAVGDISMVDESATPIREQMIRRVLSEIGVKDLLSGFDYASSFNEEIKSHQETLRSNGVEYPEVNIVAVWASFLNNLEECGKAVFPESEIDLEHTAIHFESLVNPVSPMPGALKIIEELHEAGFLLGIISNAQFFTPFLFDAFFDQSITELGFVNDISAWSFEHLQAKPGTFLYQLSVDSLFSSYGITPEEVLFVGNDLRNDVWPAAKVGFKTALFAGDDRSYRPRKDYAELKDVKADLILTDLLQLKTALALA